MNVCSESASADFIFSITGKYSPPQHLRSMSSCSSLSLLWSLKKCARLSRCFLQKPSLHPEPRAAPPPCSRRCCQCLIGQMHAPSSFLSDSHLWARRMQSASVDEVTCVPADVCRQGSWGKVKHSAGRRGLYVHYILNSNELPTEKPAFAWAMSAAGEALVSICTGEEPVKWGPSAQTNREKIASLNRGAEKRGWFLIPGCYCCLSGPDFPSFVFHPHKDNAVHSQGER